MKYFQTGSDTNSSLLKLIHILGTSFQFPSAVRQLTVGGLRECFSDMGSHIISAWAVDPLYSEEGIAVGIWPWDLLVLPYTLAP